MQFRWKLFLSFLGITLLVAGSGLWYINGVLERQIVSQTKDSLTRKAALACLVITQQGKNTLQSQIHSIAEASKARVTLINRQGVVLADSGVPDREVSHLENHLQRPEVQEALTNRSGWSSRYSETLKTTMLYHAVSVAPNGSLIRLALPMTHLDQARSDLHHLLVGVVLILLVFSFGLSVVLARVTARPLDFVTAAALQIGAGERGVRIALGHGPEFDRLAQVMNTMATRIESQVETLEEEQQRLAAILRGMGEGVMVTDHLGIIRLVNPAFKKQFGLSGPVEGQPLVSVCRQPELINAIERQRESGGDVQCELSVPLTGSTLLAHGVLLESLGSRHGVVTVFHDISELKRVEQMRRDFVANVSHELRTPVAVIKGYAETLLDGALADLPERRHHFVSIIARHAERLTALITDILTLSRLESKELQLTLHPHAIRETVVKACQLMEDHALSRGIHLISQVPDTLPSVMIDEAQIEQVLLNLIDNAIKYSPEGGTVTVACQVSGGRLMITVSDTGIGIPAKDLPRIFERFYRVDAGRSREQGGTGLGLSIVKHIVQLHNGDVRASSQPGVGTTMTVSIPIGSC